MRVSEVGPRTSIRTSASPWSNLIRTGTYIAKASGTSFCRTRSRAAMPVPLESGSVVQEKVYVGTAVP